MKRYNNDKAHKGYKFAQEVDKDALLSGKELERYVKIVMQCHAFGMYNQIDSIYHTGIAIGYNLAGIKEGSIASSSKINKTTTGSKAPSIYGKAQHNNIDQRYGLDTSGVLKESHTVEELIKHKKPIADKLSEIYYRGVQEGCELYATKKRKDRSLENAKQHPERNALTCSRVFTFAEPFKSIS